MPAPAHGGPLPTVKFTVVEPAATSPPDVGNAQLAAYGYNAGKEWPAYRDVLENGDGGRYLRWLRACPSRSPTRLICSPRTRLSQLWTAFSAHEDSADGTNAPRRAGC